MPFCNIFSISLSSLPLQLGKKIHLYWFITFFPVGVATNILSLLVMMKKQNRHFSTCIYMGVLAISDTAYLSNAFYEWYRTNTDKVFNNGCRGMIYTARVSSTFGAYEIILMTLDKAIAITIPHKAASICTANRAKLFSVLNFIFSAIWYSPHLTLSWHKQIGNSCMRNNTKGLFVTVHTYFTLVLFPLLPFIFIITANLIIIRSVWKRRRLASSNQTSSEVQLTIMLILVSLVFVILLLPMQIWASYYFFAAWKTPNEFAKSRLIFYITKGLVNMNYGVNFFLYLVSGRKFRKDLLELLHCTGQPEHQDTPRGTNRLTETSFSTPSSQMTASQGSSTQKI